jgi:hypothetical protein
MGGQFMKKAKRYKEGNVKQKEKIKRIKGKRK